MIKESTKMIFEELFVSFPMLEKVRYEIKTAYETLEATYLSHGKVLCCGNGGSASDSEHIVGELLKSFKKHRSIDPLVYQNLEKAGKDGGYLLSKLEGALPAISLVSQTGILTAFANDKAWDVAFAQQVYGLGNEGDCLIALSTSGNSQNCVNAVLVAKAKGIKTVGLVGGTGGKLKGICDITIIVPEKETYRVQELHLPIYHCICAMLEEELF